MRGVECMIVPDEMMVDVEEIVLTGDHPVQGSDEVDQVLIMGGLGALFMIGTEVHRMTGPDLLIMGDTEGIPHFMLSLSMGCCVSKILFNGHKIKI